MEAVTANLVLLGTLAGLFAGLATGIGAIPVFVVRAVRPSTGAGLLGFGAGIMLAATSFSLIVPGIDAAERQGAGPLASSSLVAAGTIGAVIGFVIMMLLDTVFG